MRSAEGQKLPRDDPVQISILNPLQTEAGSSLWLRHGKHYRFHQVHLVVLVVLGVGLALAVVVALVVLVVLGVGLALVVLLVPILVSVAVQYWDAFTS